MLIIPAAMHIETGAAFLKTREPHVIDAETHELHVAGYANPLMIAGYLLGLETCRVLVAGMPVAAMNGVTF